MKVLFVAAALVVVVSAQSLQDITECPRTCIIASIQRTTSCGITDDACICAAHNRQAIESNMSFCIDANCTKDEDLAAQNIITEICVPFSVNNPPGPGPTPEQIAAANAAYAQIPACGLLCLNATISSDGICAIDDHYCQCSPQNIFRLSDAVTPCQAKSCTSDENDVIQIHLGEMCAAVGFPPGDGDDGGSPTSVTASPTANSNFTMTYYTKTTSTIFGCPSSVSNCPYQTDATQTRSPSATPYSNQTSAGTAPGSSSSRIPPTQTSVSGNGGTGSMISGSAGTFAIVAIVAILAL